MLTVAGSISGTSVDSISYAICRITHDKSKEVTYANGVARVPGLHVEVVKSGNELWPPRTRCLLLALADPTKPPTAQSCDVTSVTAEVKSWLSGGIAGWNEAELVKIEKRASKALAGLLPSNSPILSSMAISEANFLVSECTAVALKHAVASLNSRESSSGRSLASSDLPSHESDTSKPMVQLDLVGSHGQTIWHHQIEEGLLPTRTNESSAEQSTSSGKSSQLGKISSTLQIGDGSVLATRLGATVVSGFRTADVAAAGQGAPLTSSLDTTLIASDPTFTSTPSPSPWIALQNLGGMGNVTLIPTSQQGPQSQPQLPIAFDTGPANVLLDWFAAKTTPGVQYDADGALAAQGQSNYELLRLMLRHPYFALSAPKTCGREVFTAGLGEQWLEEGIKLLSSQKAALEFTPADIQATLTDLTASSLVLSFLRFTPGALANASLSDSEQQPAEAFFPWQILIHGGGFHNTHLMKRIQHYAELAVQGKLGELEKHVYGDDRISAVFARRNLSGPMPVVQAHAASGIDPDAKESVLFALLAYLTLHGIESSVPSCTGARHPTILGSISPGTNWRHLISRI